jgi:hypothetical protein
VHIFNMYTNTVQSLNNIDWKLFELQITLSKYCLAGTDGRRKRFLDLLLPSATQVKIHPSRMETNNKEWKVNYDKGECQLSYTQFPVPFNQCIYQLLNEFWPTGIYTPRSHIGVGQKKFKVPIVKKSSSYSWAINEQ